MAQMSTRSVAAFVFAAAICAAKIARAAPLVSVERAPVAEDCPDASALSRAIARMTPKAPVPSGSEDNGAFRVLFERQQGGYSARIVVSGEHAGTRELSDPGERCSALADATALTIALILDPDATAPPPEPVREAPPPPIVEPPPRRWGIVVDAGGGIVVGLVRDVAPVFEVGVSVAPIKILSVDAAALFVPTQRLPLDRGSVDVTLVGGRLAGCLAPFDASVRVAACAGMSAGALFAAGVGYPTERSAQRSLFAGDFAVVAGGPIVGVLGWSARAGLMVPLHRQLFGIEGAGVAYESLPVAVMGTLAPTITIR